MTEPIGTRCLLSLRYCDLSNILKFFSFIYSFKDVILSHSSDSYKRPNFF